MDSPLQHTYSFASKCLQLKATRLQLVYSWLSSNETRRPSTLRGGNLLTRVSELIDPATNQWDHQLMTQTFTPADAATVMAIPICDQYEDFVAWHFDKKGLFSVRSAYWVYTELLLRQHTRQAGESTAGHQQRAWYGANPMPCACASLSVAPGS